jgi:quercetin dioxygenase-like cupin family protein
MPEDTGRLRTTVIHTTEAAKDEFDWGSTSWCISGAAGNSDSLTFGKVVIKSGASNPKHGHANCDEVLYLVSGELEHYADDTEPIRMKPGDVIFIPGGVAHWAECTSAEDAEMIVVYSSPEREIELT